MARIFLSSADHGHRAGDFPIAYQYTNPSGIAEMEGSCLAFLSNGAYVEVQFGSKKTELYVRFMHKYNGNAGWLVCDLKEDTNDKIQLCFLGNAVNAYYLKVNNVDQFCSNDAHSPIGFSEPVWIEVYFKAGTTTGQAKLWVNGDLIVDFTGNVGTANGVNRIEFGTRQPSQTPCAYYDHIAIDDANRIGHSKVIGRFPSGAGSAAQFTPSTSPNWDCANEVAAVNPTWAPDLETDYNSVNVVDQKDLFVPTALPAEATGVKCVALRTRAFKNGTPTPTNITPLIKTGGTEYAGDNVAGAAIPNHGNKIWETNPNTANPWTPTEVNNLEIGYKSAA